MSNPQQVGAFVPTTSIWDVSEVYALNGIDEGLKELLIRLYQNLNRRDLVINIKDSGYYPTQEFVNGQLFFPNPTFGSGTQTNPAYRQVLRKVINFGALPNTATKSVPHGIVVTSTLSWTRVYGIATNPGVAGLPIPYASTNSADIIELNVDTTNVNITTGGNGTAFTICYVILEYIIV